MTPRSNVPVMARPRSPVHRPAGAISAPPPFRARGGAPQSETRPPQIFEDKPTSPEPKPPSGATSKWRSELPRLGKGGGNGARSGGEEREWTAE